MSTIAERLLLLRGKIKQGEFAKTLEINPNTLRSYENGRTSPNQEFLEQICVQFSVSPEWLLLGRGPMRPGEPAPTAQGSAPAPHTPPQRPVDAQESACARCTKLEARLDEVERERRELTNEVRQITAENRQLWKDNGALREKCARLEERQYRVERKHDDSETVGNAG